MLKLLLMVGLGTILITIIWRQEIKLYRKQLKCGEHDFKYDHQDYFAFVPWQVYKCSKCGKEKSVLGHNQ